MADQQNGTEQIEADAEEIGAELEPIQQQGPPPTLFRTDNPVKVIERATEAANALRDVIRKQGLAVRIKGKWHVLVEGWQTCGAMLGVTSVCEWTRPVDDGWEARVVAQTLDGRVIGAAEAQCLSTEPKPWDKAEGHAIRSMAQTRATSKALASALRFIVTLAGYEGTPAEEAQAGVPSGGGQKQKAEQAEPVETIGDEAVQQLGELMGKAKQLGLSFEQLSLMFGAAGADAPSIDRGDSKAKAVRALTSEQADHLFNAVDAFIADTEREAKADA